MTAASLTPPVAYRLGCWLAAEPYRSYEYFEDTGEVVASLFARKDGESIADCVGAGAGVDLDTAVLRALDEANGGA